MHQPIKVASHGVIDYGLFAAAVAGPRLLGLTGAARVLPTAFGATQGLLNAITDQPLAARKVVPFRKHGQLETVAVPAFAAAVALSGAWRGVRAGAFLSTMLASLAAVYVLTDWDAAGDERPAE
ncbi:hypothetical protein [Patulibacter americanus]|uniref:hypothetical protein n=1 Tax=Patulibacter americanus TaxID=588672 RepID=UPI0003B3B396|nr:hypothetical protein [Patulibacter americanus]